MNSMNSTTRLFQAAAKRLPGIEEGIACKGTTLECATFKVKKKAFLFVRAGEVRLKLTESEGEAAKLAKAEPTRYKVGANGWVQLKFGQDDRLPRKRIERWVKESYSGFAEDTSPGKPARPAKR